MLRLGVWIGLFLASTFMLGCSQINANKTSLITDASRDVLGLSARFAIPSQLPPQYLYLRVDVEGRAPSVFVLGYIDKHPQGDIEVWYSAVHETLYLQNGRIVRSAGFEADWRDVAYPSQLPPWREVIDGLNAHTKYLGYVRSRDVMPGYRFGIQENLLWSSGSPPEPVTQDVLHKQLVWVRESVERPSDDPKYQQPVAWFGLDRNDLTTVQVSYQCLSSSLCLRLQRWPANSNASR